MLLLVRHWHRGHPSRVRMIHHRALGEVPSEFPNRAAGANLVGRRPERRSAALAARKGRWLRPALPAESVMVHIVFHPTHFERRQR
jgi:hypothetical protein